jgi:hypothetical protein
VSQHRRPAAAATAPTRLISPVSPVPSGWHQLASSTFNPEPGSVPTARHRVREAIRQWGVSTDCEETVLLLVSEVVTNAVVHAQTPFSVKVYDTDNGHVRVEVRDSSPLLPRVPHSSVASPGSRGLRLMAALSSSYGADPLGPGEGDDKRIWFEVPRTLTSEHASLAVSFDETMEIDWLTGTEQP